jgi:hypothetical protein
MSVAPEFPPVVHIPARARRRAALALVGSNGSNGSAATAFELDLVDADLVDLVGLEPAPRLRLVRPALDAPSAPAVAPESRPVRLTRRGWLVLAVLGAAVAVALLGFAHASAPTPASARGPAPAAITVHDGDTLWTIAAQVAPGHDPRAVVDQLEQINHLSGADLVPGQVLHTR